MQVPVDAVKMVESRANTRPTERNIALKAGKLKTLSPSVESTNC